MSKIKFIVLTLISSIILFGCTEVEEKVVYVDEDGNEIKAEMKSEIQYGRFHSIEGGDFGDSYEILKDAETGCEYIYIKGSHAGGLSPIYESPTKMKGCNEWLT